MGNYKKVIAVIGVWLYEEKEYNFIKELNEICREMGYVVMAFNFSIDSLNLDEDIMREKKLVELMGHLECEAVIIMGETIKNDRMYEYIRKIVKTMNVPAFALERPVEGCINIVMEFGDGFRDIMHHVIDHHGCRKINMIAGIRDNDFSEARIAAYKEVLEEYGIPFEEKRLAYGDFWDRPARLATKQFIEDGDIPDAIVCANDAMAIAACSMLRENGYRVPDDVIVTGFDGIASGKVNFPAISTVEPDNEAEIRLIFNLLDKIQKGDKVDTDTTYTAKYKVCANESCGCSKSDDEVTMGRMNTISVALNDQKWHMMALNKLLLFSNDMKKLSDMTPLLEESVGMWLQNLYFVAVYEQFLNVDLEFDENVTAYPDSKECRTMLRIQDFENITDNKTFNEDELIPDMHELFLDDKGYDMFMVRLLQTKSSTYGYLVEGFRNVDERALRRCEEFGLFLSTTINSVLKNQKLIQLNEKLETINKEIERKSVLDYLTELYNRRGFYDELYRQVNSPSNKMKYLTFFSIDMDGLKVINDTYGHNEGDFALKSLAAAIKHFAVRNGISARYGGDEFVCAIITEQKTTLTADVVRDRFEATFRKNEELKGKPYTVSASIGGMCARIDDDLDVEELMRVADEEMYKDKLQRRQGR